MPRELISRGLLPSMSRDLVKAAPLPCLSLLFMWIAEGARWEVSWTTHPREVGLQGRWVAAVGSPQKRGLFHARLGSGAQYRLTE